VERRKKFEEAYKSASLERGKQKLIIGGPDFEVCLKNCSTYWHLIVYEHGCRFEK
jgi:hypothetical protein